PTSPMIVVPINQMCSGSFYRIVRFADISNFSGCRVFQNVNKSCVSHELNDIVFGSEHNFYFQAVADALARFSIMSFIKSSRACVAGFVKRSLSSVLAGATRSVGAAFSRRREEDAPLIFAR